MSVKSNKASVDVHDQQKRLLTELRRGPVSTLKARAKLDILHPAGRVKELRERGFNVVTHWRTEKTALGKHRVAEYVLHSGKWQGRAAA